MCRLSEESRRKLGNIMIYIAQNSVRPCKTKVLKLIYLMEEQWVLATHTPFTGLPFEVWQHGPVEKDVFVELSDGFALLKEYVSMKAHVERPYMQALKDFDEDEFSDNELRMMKQVMEKYGNMTAKELVTLTHKVGSLWHREAQEHGLLEAFRKSSCNSSDIVMDFSKILAPCDASFYKDSLEVSKAANYYGA